MRINRYVSHAVVLLFAALLGAILVLIVGALWRRSKQTEPVQKPGAAE